MKRNITICISPNLLEEIDRLRGLISRSVYSELIIKKGLEVQNERDESQ